MKNLKRFVSFLLAGSLFAAALFMSSCFVSGFFGTQDSGMAEVEKAEGKGSAKITEEELEQLLNNEDFLETFDTFYYPGSMVQEAMAVEDKQGMIYVILETMEEFDIVEDYYKNKKVQSIWNRDFIYQKSMAEVEEDFIESEEEDIDILKFTYSSKDRDKIVDILLKELDGDRTQIMITCWNLQ
jgi:hypothetical protein